MDIVRQFCDCLPKTVDWSISKTNDSIMLEIGPEAQVEFFNNGSIMAMIDSFDYFHVWEMLNNKNDFTAAVKKIVDFYKEKPEPVSNRILNAVGV